MFDLVAFQSLLSRVRAGDPEAACEIVARYESAIRVAVRTRMSDPAMRRQFDSEDICQSVLGSFLLRMAAGIYDIKEPVQLVALLTSMAHKKLAMRIRYERRRCRDTRRAVSLDASMFVAVSRDCDPFERVMNTELAQRAYELMDAATRNISRERMNNSSWPEIATKFGGTAESCRKRYERAIDRIANALGVDENFQQSP